MSKFGWAAQWQPLDSTNSSTYTSPAYSVIEYASQSLSIITLGTSASRFTVQQSNVNGMNAAIVEGDWSTVTAITSQGPVTIDPGSRWMRVLRSSLESTSTLAFSFWAS